MSLALFYLHVKYVQPRVVSTRAPLLGVAYVELAAWAAHFTPADSRETAFFAVANKRGVLSACSAAKLSWRPERCGRIWVGGRGLAEAIVDT